MKRLRRIVFFLWLVSATGLHAYNYTLSFTASLRGNITGCDCRFHPAAGLPALAAAVEELGPFDYLIDLGDFSDGTGDALLADSILEIQQRIGYDRVLPGVRDLSLSWVDFSQAHLRFPGLGAENSILPYYAVLPPAEIDVELPLFGIEEPAWIGLVEYDPGSGGAFLLSSHRRILDRLEKSVQPSSCVIVAFYGSQAEAESIAAAYPWIDLLLFGGEEEPRGLYQIGTVWMTSPQPRGNQLGILELVVENGEIVSMEDRSRYLRFSDSARAHWVEEAADQYYRQLLVPSMD